MAAMEETVFLGLGANLGDAPRTLAAARDALAELEGVRLTACSSLYRTAPVGGPSGQPDYLNAVLALRTALAPRELLERCRAVEARFGRTRSARWGPRTLDIDLLLFGARVVDEPGLAIPHPRLHTRRFVLAPLCQLAPGRRHPVLDRPLCQLLAELADPCAVRRLPGAW